MDFNELITISQTRPEIFFHHYLEQAFKPTNPLLPAIKYTFLNGGKRLRPLLIYTIGKMFHAPLKNLDVVACSIELLHTYSLIYDDLPAMDNTDIRRGKLACHKVFGEGTAILAGDALQFLAIELITTYPNSLSSLQRLNMLAMLSKSCGANGIAGGQAFDIHNNFSQDTVINMYLLKTSTLFVISTKLALIAANVKDTRIKNALIKVAQDIGLAFQIQDDLEDSHAKYFTVKQAKSKRTYVDFFGKDNAYQKIQDLFKQAMETLAFLGKQAELLKEFMAYLMEGSKLACQPLNDTLNDTPEEALMLRTVT